MRLESLLLCVALALQAGCGNGDGGGDPPAVGEGEGEGPAEGEGEGPAEGEGEGPAEGEGPPPRVCEPAAARTCPCPGGLRGVETCLEGLCVERGPGAECAEHEECGEQGLCHYEECKEPWGRRYVITVVAAHVAGDGWDLIGAPDPMAELIVGEQRFTTTMVANSADARWLETFEADVRQGEAVHWRLWDVDPDMDDLVGAWQYADGFPLDVLRDAGFFGATEDGESWLDLWIWPAE